MSEYARTIEDIHAEIDRLRQKVRRGVLPQVTLDSYVTAARQRTDWREVA